MHRPTTVAGLILCATLTCALVGVCRAPSARAAAVAGKAEAPAAKPKIDQLELLAILERGDTAELEALLDALQSAVERDLRNERDLQRAFETFTIHRPDLEARLVAWSKRSPKSFAAQLALARYYASRAWQARGSKFADQTQPEQFADMNRFFVKAVESSSAALALQPASSEAYALLINVAMARGEHARRDDLIRRALAQAPASYRIRRAVIQTLRPRWGGSHVAMQQFAEDSQRYADANPRLRELRGMAVWDAGTVAVTDKNYGGAVELFTLALQAGPNAEFYASRADAYVRMNEHEKALADANESLLLYPQVASVLADRARALGGTGNIEVAVADLELATKLDPDDDGVVYARDWLSASLVRAGCDLEKQGKYDDALARFDDAARIDPNGAEVLYRRGRTLIQKGQLSRARQDMERAIELRPRYFDAYQTLDWLLAKEGRWDDVIGRWNTFIALEPDNANAYLERAGSYRHKGDMRSALADLKSACDLGNGNACQILAQAGR